MPAGWTGSLLLSSRVHVETSYRDNDCSARPEAAYLIPSELACKFDFGESSQKLSKRELSRASDVSFL